MDRRLRLAITASVLAVVMVACQPVDGGAGDSLSPDVSAGGESGASSSPSQGAEATPSATSGTDYGY